MKLQFEKLKEDLRYFAVRGSWSDNGGHTLTTGRREIPAHLMQLDGVQELLAWLDQSQQDLRREMADMRFGERPT